MNNINNQSSYSKIISKNKNPKKSNYKSRRKTLKIDSIDKIKVNDEINNINDNKENLNNDNNNKNSMPQEYFNTYNDNEINSLNYPEAKKIDKRTYCQYYTSLIKTKHILFFTFFPNSDYNSQIIKIYIFFFTFVINYGISAMFYTDFTMHKIYEDKGSFDFAFQLPKMFYSLILSSILKITLSVFGLYETNIIDIKKRKSMNKIYKILFRIKCKVFLFFVFTYIILFFIWYYLGCFCAVYKNTQIHLLKEVSSSFAISFITPFFIYLLPGIFRIPALKSKLNKAFLYKFSKLLQVL